MYIGASLPHRSSNKTPYFLMRNITDENFFFFFEFEKNRSIAHNMPFNLFSELLYRRGSITYAAAVIQGCNITKIFLM